MNISEKQLRRLLERSWDMSKAAEWSGVNEPALKDAEIDGLIDSVEEEPDAGTTQGALFDETDCETATPRSP